MDNLNTHTPASFYEVFPPEQAKALIDRLEIHYIPSMPAGSILPRSN
jgi:hypothetical protein